MPDGDLHIVSAGIGYGTERWAVDLAYEYLFWNRDVSGSMSGDVDGRWEDGSDSLALSLTFRF